MVEGTSSHAVPEGARCATHPDEAAGAVCSRCGDFCCVACARYGASAIHCSTCHEALSGAMRVHHGEASMAQRFVNYLIDMSLGIGTVGVIVATALVIVGAEEFLDEVPDLVFNVVAATIYYVSMEGMFGRTLGKLVTGTAVIAADGGKPSFKQLLGRSLARFVPFEALSFWLGDAFWHDSWSGTAVVRVRAPKGDVA